MDVWDLDDFARLLQWRSEQTPTAIAYRFLNGDQEDVYTYAKLDDRVRVIASQIQAVTSNRQSRAVILVPQGPDYVASYFACLYAGVIAVPVYTPKKNQKQTRLLSIIQDCSPEVILTTQDVLSNFKSSLSDDLIGIPSVIVDAFSGFSKDDYKHVNVESEEIAFLQYTSGSTGSPKGVMVTHANLMHNSAMMYEALGHNDESRIVSWLPAFHDMGLIAGVLQPIYGGFEAVLMTPVSFLQKPVRWLKAISDYKGTTSGGPNFAYDLCVQSVSNEEADLLDLSSWQVAANGAEPVRGSTLDNFVSKFKRSGLDSKSMFPCYGMAEATLLVTGGDKYLPHHTVCLDVDELQKNHAIESIKDATQSYEVVGCGRVYKNQVVKIVDSDTKLLCGPNIIGEIWLSGGSVAKGYWGREKESEQTFNAYITDSNDGPYLRTGDLGFIKDEELFITGRLKDLIIIHGKNHYPQDIEFSVEGCHQAFQEGGCAAFSIDSDGEERLVIVQEIKREYLLKLDLEEAITIVTKMVSDSYHIKVYGVAFIKPFSLCRTSSGKVQRHACKSAFLSEELKLINKESRFVDVVSEFVVSDCPEIEVIDLDTQEKLKNWIKFRISNELKAPIHLIDDDESLTSYGLDSVVAVKFAGELERKFRCEISSTFMYDYPTINSIATFLLAQNHLLTGNGNKTVHSSSVYLTADDIEKMSPQEVNEILENYISQ